MNARYVAVLVFFAAALAACSSADPDPVLEAPAAGDGGSPAGPAPGDAAASSSGGSADAGCAYGATYCWGGTCACELSPPSPNCVTANANGEPSGGCDDGNPCTEDVPDPSAPGGCRHLFAGLGSSCSADGAMRCVVGGTGEQCCPVDPHPACSVEGARGECAAGSVCLEGMCWIGCSVDGDCAAAPGDGTCGTLSVGHVSARVCGV